MATGSSFFWPPAILARMKPMMMPATAEPPIFCIAALPMAHRNVVHKRV